MSSHYDWAADVADLNATQERLDLEKLKADWRRDPCWDIEDTDGYEQHRDELLAYSLETKARWKAEREEYRRRYPERYRVGTFDDPVLTVQWINEQAAEGYRVVSLTPGQIPYNDGSDRGSPGFVVLMETSATIAREQAEAPPLPSFEQINREYMRKAAEDAR